MPTGFTQISIDWSKVEGTRENGTVKFYSYSPITLSTGTVVAPNPRPSVGNGGVTLSSGLGSIYLAPTDNPDGLGYGSRYKVTYTGVADTTERTIGSIWVTSSDTALDLAALLAADVTPPAAVTPDPSRQWLQAATTAAMQQMQGLNNGDRVFVNDKGVYRAEVPPVTAAQANIALTSTDGRTRFVLEVDGKDYRQVVDVRLYGAVADGTTDSTAAIQAAATAAGQGGTLVFPGPGTYVASGTITLPDYQTWEGTGDRFGAVATPAAQIRWDVSGSTVGVQAGTNCRFRNLVLRGPGSGVGTCTGLINGSSGASSHARFHSCTFYGWATGVSLVKNYYTYFYDCEWNACATAMKVDGCYNIHLYGPTFRSCPVAVNFITGCTPFTIHGGSIESYGSSGGFILTSGAHLSVLGAYWESSASDGGIGITGAGGASVVLVGNYVQLNKNNRWVNLSGLTGANLYARGNRFAAPIDSTTSPFGYVLPTTGTVDLADDTWVDVLKVGAAYIGSTLASGGVAEVSVSAPSGISGYLSEHSFLGRSVCLPKLTAAPTGPKVGSVYLADNSSWDPLAVPGTNPYFVTYDGSAFVPLTDIGGRLNAAGTTYFGTAPTALSTYLLGTAGTNTTTSGSNTALLGFLTATPGSSSSATYRGVYGRVNSTAQNFTATPFSVASFHGINSNSSSGTIASSVNFFAEGTTNTGGGTITTWYGFRCGTNSTAGTNWAFYADTNDSYFGGNVHIGVAGKSLRIKEGSNATMGAATLVGGTVTVNTTAVTANSRIFLTHQNTSGTIGVPYISARVAGTSFTITSSSGTDTSSIAWVIVEPL